MDNWHILYQDLLPKECHPPQHRFSIQIVDCILFLPIDRYPFLSIPSLSKQWLRRTQGLLLLGKLSTPHDHYTSLSRFVTWILNGLRIFYKYHLENHVLTSNQKPLPVLILWNIFCFPFTWIRMPHRFIMTNLWLDRSYANTKHRCDLMLTFFSIQIQIHSVYLIFHGYFSLRHKIWSLLSNKFLLFHLPI